MIEYLKKLIASNSKESSKRFIAIFTAMGLMGLAFIYSESSNIVTVLSILCTYVLSLMGISVYEKIKNGKNE